MVQVEPSVQTCPFTVVAECARSALVTSPVAVNALVTVRPAMDGETASTIPPLEPVTAFCSAAMTPVPAPERPVEIGKLVMLAALPLAGVPRIGAMNVGPVVSATPPVPDVLRTPKTPPLLYSTLPVAPPTIPVVPIVTLTALAETVQVKPRVQGTPFTVVAGLARLAFGRRPVTPPLPPAARLAAAR